MRLASSYTLLSQRADRGRSDAIVNYRLQQIIADESGSNGEIHGYRGKGRFDDYWTMRLARRWTVTVAAVGPGSFLNCCDIDYLALRLSLQPRSHAFGSGPQLVIKQMHSPCCLRLCMPQYAANSRQVAAIVCKEA